MATIRVFLLACRRPAMLRRALDSLRAQTFTDWVCELHNDAPDDAFPRQLVGEMGDTRITLHEHAKNWGALAVFNHACAGSPEPYFSILEDDNWWEPTLLARLLDALEATRECSVVWSNLRFWREMPDGSWKNEGRTLWPILDVQAVKICQPQLIQFDGPLHSNGAMLVRSSAALDKRLILPSGVPFSAMENLRERFFRGPLLFVPEPLANFALTLGSAREDQRARWAGQQALMGAEFLRQLHPPSGALKSLWISRRNARPRATAGLILAGIVARDLRFLGYATPRDWLTFAAGFVRRPAISISALRARTLQPELAQSFARATRALATEAPTASTGEIPAFALAEPMDLTAAWAKVVKAPAPEPAATPRSVGIDAWRGLACLAVVLFHGSNSLPASVHPIVSAIASFGLLGWLGVPVFFVLSGHCILEVIERRARQGIGPTTFWADRFRRIYPAYWAALALSIGLALLASPFNHLPLKEAFPPNLLAWLQNLALVNGWTGGANRLTVAWTLELEIGFYVMVGFLLFRPTAQPVIRFALLAVVTVCAHLPDVALWIPVLKYWPLFACGLAAHAARQSALPTAARMLAVLYPTLIVIYAAITAEPSLLCAGLLALGLMKAPMLSAFRPPNFLVRIGLASYSIYLVHIPVMSPLRNLAHRIMPVDGLAYVVFWFAHLAASVFAGIIFHLWVETPLEAYRKRLRPR